MDAKRKIEAAAPRKPPPVGKASKRRDEILQVAAQLFAAKGYEETTIREIGDAAGILSGSLYHHFQTKEEMLHDLLRGFILMIPEYQAIVDRGEGTRETICAMIDLALRTDADRLQKFANAEVEGLFVHGVLREPVKPRSLAQDVGRLADVV